MSSPVVFVGSATLDAIALVDVMPQVDDRQEALAVEFAGGGPAATAAVACSRLGVPAAFVGAVGDDQEGQQIKEGLRVEGVDTSAVRTVPATRSGASVVLASRAQAARAICTRRAVPLELDDAARHMLLKAEWVHVDHAGWTVVRPLRHRPRDRRFRLSVDAGNPIVPYDLTGVDLYVPNEHGLRRDVGAASMDDMLAAAATAGARTVVVTRGAAGAVALTSTGARLEAPGFHIEVVSTLGAGDVFHGALLAAKLQGQTLSEALLYASVAAAISCRAVDGRSAIPTHDEVLKAIAEEGRERDH
jgi:sulfofructose kinase